jgi:hypothetical protein
VPFDDLEDLPPIVKASTKGRPVNKLMQKLTVPCKQISTGVNRFRCVADGCHQNWAARQAARIYPHAATQCKFIDSKLRKEALLQSSADSLGAQVELNEGGDADFDPEGVEVINVDAGPNKASLYTMAKAAGKKKEQHTREARLKKTNLLTLKLICDAALPPRLVDNPHFRTLVDFLEPDNGIAVASTFSNNYIPQEASRITLLSIEKLKKIYHLTISYDGGTLKGNSSQSVYTVHITTPDGREVYFMEGNEASGKSHTGEHIKEVLLKVCV